MDNYTIENTEYDHNFYKKKKKFASFPSMTQSAIFFGLSKKLFDVTDR